MNARFSGAFMLAALLGACGHTQSEDSARPTRPTSSAGAGGGGGSGGGSDTAAGAPPNQAPQADCNAPAPGPAPAPRLHHEQLWLSLRSVLQVALPDEPAVTSQLGLWDDDTTSDVTAVEAEGLHKLAHQLAERVSQSVEARRLLTGCDETAAAASCRDQFLERFLKRAYRRPLLEEDRSEMREVFDTGQELGGDFASGVRAVLEVAFQTPDFGYVLELGSAEAQGDVVPLTSFETAARLSYFLTNAPPDDALFAAAEAGPLGPEQIEAQARRLLGTPANRARVQRFYERTFPLSGGGLEPELGYGADIVALAGQETSRFIDDVTFEGKGTFRALLTEPSTWVNEELAKFYGYGGVSGAAFQKIALAPEQRSGLFTQISFLHATSPGARSNPVHRGLGVLMPLLCYDPPPPPANLAPRLPEVPPGSTTRERLSIATSPSECRTCHQDINPIGFAFEHYDAVGRWRDTEAGATIDASGDLTFTDARGHFASAPELLARIAESEDARDCYIGHWLDRAYERAVGDADACARTAVSKAFHESDGKITELLVAVAKTDNLRYRLKAELVP